MYVTVTYIHIEANHCVISLDNVEVCCSHVKWSFRYKAMTGPWNIGHPDLHLY